MNDDDESVGRKARKVAYFLFGLAACLAIFVPSTLMILKGQTAIAALNLDAWGDFLAGAFGPASLFVLAAGFLLQFDEIRLQRNELRQTRETLSQQETQLRRTAEEANQQRKILSNQLFSIDWKLSCSQFLHKARLIETSIRRRGFISASVQISDDVLFSRLEHHFDKMDDARIKQYADIFMRDVDKNFRIEFDEYIGFYHLVTSRELNRDAFYQIVIEHSPEVSLAKCIFALLERIDTEILSRKEIT